MKQRVDVFIEKSILRLARQKAAEAGRPLGDLIQDALAQYLNKSATTPKERTLAFQLFCERPMKIPKEQLRYLLNEDMWNG